MQCQNLYKSSSKQTIQTICILIHMISFNFVLIIKKSDALHEHILHKIGVLFGLNSNLIRNSENIDSASDLAEDVLMKCGNGEIMLFTIQSTVSIDQGSPDGRGGFLLVYQSKAGSKYGIVVLFSYTKTIWMKTKSITWGKWVKTQLS